MSDQEMVMLRKLRQILSLFWFSKLQHMLLSFICFSFFVSWACQPLLSVMQTIRLANPQAPLCSRTPDQIRSSTGAASLPPPSPGCRANRSPRSRPARLGPSRAANRRRPARPLLAESANSCVGQAWPGVRSSGGSRGSGGAKAEVAAPGPGVERS